MSLADKITASRLVLAPIFFVLFMWGGNLFSSVALVTILWILFVVMELSDMFDGMAARKYKQVSSFGKLFDPFADVVERLTYFVCFSFSGIMPIFLFVIIIYREFSQLFLRQLLAEKGIAMAARKGGKTKAVFYMLAGAFSLILWSIRTLACYQNIESTLNIIVLVLYYIAAFLSVASFVDYIVQYKKYSSKKG